MESFDFESYDDDVRIIESTVDKTLNVKVIGQISGELSGGSKQEFEQYFELSLPVVRWLPFVLYFTYYVDLN